MAALSMYCCESPHISVQGLFSLLLSISSFCLHLTIHLDLHRSFYEDQDRHFYRVWQRLSTIWHHNDCVQSRDDNCFRYTSFVHHSSPVQSHQGAQMFLVHIMLSRRLQQRKHTNRIQAEHSSDTMYMAVWFCLWKLSAHPQQTNPQQEKRTGNNNSPQGLLTTHKALKCSIIMHFLLSSPFKRFKRSLKWMSVKRGLTFTATLQQHPPCILCWWHRRWTST